MTYLSEHMAESDMNLEQLRRRENKKELLMIFDLQTEAANWILRVIITKNMEAQQMKYFSFPASRK